MRFPIILASASPRRKKLLEQIGLKFTVKVSDIDENNVPNLPPEKLAEYLSLKKAKKLAKEYPKSTIIGADTLIVCNKKILGKPKSKQNAKEILKKLRGRMHVIITGVTVIKARKIQTSHVSTKVYFKKLTDDEINAYIKTGEPMDKAGAYGIQEKGVLFVERIDGDYPNVVGLPLVLIDKMLKELG